MDGASDPCTHVLQYDHENHALHNLLGRVYDALPDANPVKSMLMDEYAALINQYDLPANAFASLTRASLNRLHQQRQLMMQQELLAHQLYVQQQQQRQILLMQQKRVLLQQQTAMMEQVAMNAQQQPQQQEPLEAKSGPTPVPSHAEPERPAEHVVPSFPPANNVRKLSAHQLRIRYEQSRQFERMIRQDQADKESEAVWKRVQQMSQSSPLVKKRVKVTVTPMTPVCFEEPPTPMTPLSPFTPMTELSEMTPDDTDF